LRTRVIDKILTDCR